MLYHGDTTRTSDAMLVAAREALAASTRVGVLGSARDVAAFRSLGVLVAELGPDNDAERTAARLYAALRELDAAGVELILAREPEREDGLWRALRDRLRRAASQVVSVDDTRS
jgi:L-threonylcarbamoyladenylate synthase